jgi:hypothetical protein
MRDTSTHPLSASDALPGLCRAYQTLGSWVPHRFSRLELVNQREYKHPNSKLFSQPHDIKPTPMFPTTVSVRIRRLFLFALVFYFFLSFSHLIFFLLRLVSDGAALRHVWQSLLLPKFPDSSCTHPHPGEAVCLRHLRESEWGKLVCVRALRMQRAPPRGLGCSCAALAALFRSQLPCITRGTSSGKVLRALFPRTGENGTPFSFSFGFLFCFRSLSLNARATQLLRGVQESLPSLSCAGLEAVCSVNAVFLLFPLSFSFGSFRGRSHGL